MKIWSNKNIVTENDCKKFPFLFWGNFATLDCTVLATNEYASETVCQQTPLMQLNRISWKYFINRHTVESL